MTVGWFRSLLVPCPSCGARRHKPCKDVQTKRRLDIMCPHSARVMRANKEIKKS